MEHILKWERPRISRRIQVAKTATTNSRAPKYFTNSKHYQINGTPHGFTGTLAVIIKITNARAQK